MATETEEYTPSGVLMPPPAEVWRIAPSKAGVLWPAREFWAYRHTLGFFARRFNEKRYNRTWLGRAWVIIRPVLTIGAQVFVFGGVLGVKTDGVPYLLVFLIAFAAWQLFSESAYWATRSLELNRSIVRRLYVPRLVMLVASSFPALVDLLVFLAMICVSVSVFFISDGTTHLHFGLRTLLMLPAMAMLICFGLSVGLWLAVPGSQARDVRFTLTFGLNFVYFLTPVVYPLSSVPESYRFVAEINPLTMPVQLVKNGALGPSPLPMLSIVSSLVVLAILLAAGLRVFLGLEASARDNV